MKRKWMTCIFQRICFKCLFSKDSDYIQFFQGYIMIEKQDMLFLTKNGVQGKLSEMVKNYVENYPRSNIIPSKFDLE